MSLSQYKVLVFDCYGTLIDWERGMLDNLTRLLEQPTAPSEDVLFKILGKHETRIQTESPTMLYPEVLRNVYVTVAEEFGLKYDPADAVAFGNSIGTWPAFPDSADALSKLHDAGLNLVILSNVNNASFDKSKQKLEKGFAFDAIYTAEKIGSYKPSLRNFDYAIQHIKEDFDLSPDDILIVANSKLHDIQPGHAKNLKSAWIDRPRAIMGVSEYAHVQPDWSFSSMAEFAEAISPGRS